MSEEVVLKHMGGLYYAPNGDSRYGLSLLVRLDERRWEAMGRPSRIAVTIQDVESPPEDA